MSEQPDGIRWSGPPSGWDDTNRERIGRRLTPGARPSGAAAGDPIFTIGHGTRAIAEFVSLLRQVDVDLVADIRSFPRSRTNPQFDIDVLPASLAAEGIEYRHLAALGGRRHRLVGAPPSTNLLWREASFRNYADYAETEPFRAGLDELLGLARDHRVALMCAEAVWWRCHRRIVADSLLARGVRVEHILRMGEVMPAVLTPGAVAGPDGNLQYSGPHPAVPITRT